MQDPTVGRIVLYMPRENGEPDRAEPHLDGTAPWPALVTRRYSDTAYVDLTVYPPSHVQGGRSFSVAEVGPTSEQELIAEGRPQKPGTWIWPPRATTGAVKC